VFGRAHRHEREFDLGAAQPLGRAGGDIALVQLDLGPQGGQRLQVQVHWPRPDGAAARQRHLGLAGARQQRAQHVEAGPHLPDQLIGGEGRADAAAVEQGLLPVRALALGDLDAQRLQQLAQELCIREARHIGQQQRLIRQDRGGHQLEGGILGAAHGDDPVQLGAAGDGDAVHVVSCGPARGRQGDRLSSAVRRGSERPRETCGR
jgi:hypothetical protein